MKLDLGGQETIVDPTPEQVAHYLQFMPAESPFVILERCEGEFVQAIIEEGRYRVEYKENQTQWFTVTDYEKAVSIFEAFLFKSNAISEMASWEKLYLLNPATRKWIGVLITLIFLGLIAFGLWHELDQWLEIYR